MTSPEQPDDRPTFEQLMEQAGRAALSEGTPEAGTSKRPETPLPVSSPEPPSDYAWYDF